MSDTTESLEIRVPAQEGEGTDLLHSETKIVGAVVSYIGTGYSGFAFQSGLQTIAGELIRAIEICLGHKPKLTVAGRTDSGVHARAQVISFPIGEDQSFDSERFLKSMNSLLGEKISVRAAWIASPGFSARFSARFRRYRYRFVFSGTPDPFRGPTSWMVPPDLDVSSMRKGAQLLLGEHDFSSFCRKDPQGASLTRRVEEIELEEVDDELLLWIKASSFCHQMVRSMAGLLYQVGRSKFPPEYVGSALAARDRSMAKLLAPPSGLVLWEVGYDEGVLPNWF